MRLRAPKANNATAFDLVARPVATAWLLHGRQHQPDDALLAVLSRHIPEAGTLWLAVQRPVQIAADATIALAFELLAASPHHIADIRLVGSGAATPGPASPAATLAARLGVDVLVPTGSLLFVPDGSLFVHGPGGNAGWRRFSADGGHADTGPRLPVPAWDAAARLATILPSPAAVIEQIPAGVWLRSARGDVAGLDDLAYAIPPSQNHLRVLIGATGNGPVPADAAGALLRALPASVRLQTELVPYGNLDSATCLAVAAVAETLGEPVLVGCGIPTVEQSGTHSRRCVAANGEPTWEPFGRLLRFHPGRTAPETVEAAPPVAGWHSAPGLNTWPLVPGWQVDALPGGLWIRAALTSATPWPREGAAADPDQVAVIVGDPGSTIPPDLWPAVAALISRLPTPARSRARVVVPHSALGSPDLAILTDAAIPIISAAPPRR